MVGEEVDEQPPADETGPRCETCGSPNLTYFEADYETGVYAPDGFAETRCFYGYRCDDCGGLTEIEE